MNNKKIELSPFLNQAIKNYLSNQSVSYKTLAQMILELSHYYIQNQGSLTPWQSSAYQLAQASYYLPLNSLRSQMVVHRLKPFGFFDDLTHLVDFGSGLGAASLSIQENVSTVSSIDYVEQSRQAIKLHQEHFHLKNNATARWQYNPHQISLTRSTLAVFSYSFLELPSFPEWISHAEAIIIIEPSTHQASRNLMKQRNRLIELGFHIWAPCTHHQNCPLLQHSQGDWCHDRLHWIQPDWYSQIESQLIIKNRTLTFSYLAARKKSPPTFSLPTARITGDPLKEKGKTRQLICVNDQRQFLTWLNKAKNYKKIPRGCLISVPDDLNEKSNELRVYQKNPEILFDL